LSDTVTVGNCRPSRDINAGASNCTPSSGYSGRGTNTAAKGDRSLVCGVVSGCPGSCGTSMMSP
jgi:hypothetical protein